MEKKRFEVEQIDHVEIYVPDREQAAKWYERVFGLRVIEAFRFWAVPGGPLMMQTAQGNTKLALFEGPAQGSTAERGLRLVAFAVSGEGFIRFIESLPELNLRDHTGQVLNKNLVADHDKSYSIYFSDPWGNRFEITSYDYELITEKSANK